MRCKIELLVDLLYMHVSVDVQELGWADHNMTGKRRPSPKPGLPYPTETEASPWQRADSLTPKRVEDEISDVLPGR